MEVQQGGIWLFGKFMVPEAAAAAPLPVQPPQEEEEVPPALRRLTIKFAGKQYPCLLFSSAVQTILSSMGVDSSSRRRHRPRHVITRTLTPSDVKKRLSRLLIPRRKVALSHFLRRREEKRLRERDADGKLKKIAITVVDPSLEVRALNLTRWNYMEPANPNAAPRKNWSYALHSGWTHLVRTNRLAAGDTLQIWRFRKPDNSLGFLIFKI